MILLTLCCLFASEQQWPRGLFLLNRFLETDPISYITAAFKEDAEHLNKKQECYQSWSPDQLESRISPIIDLLHNPVFQLPIIDSGN